MRRASGRAEGRPAGVRVRAADLVRGAVRLEEGADGWVRPWRVTEGQLRVLGSVSAWHPGLFCQMARTTAGVRLELETDARSLELEVRVDEVPSGSARILADVRRHDPAAPGLLDGVSLDVDGRHLGPLVPRAGATSLVVPLEDASPVAPAAGDEAREGVAAAPEPPGGAQGGSGAPGGAIHHVRVWLPCLRGCELRTLTAHGSFVRAPLPRPELLVVGDSVAQGFVTGDPGLAWPSLLATRLGLDLVNQSVGGQVFQPSFVAAGAEALSPAAVVVALGANYRFEPCGETRMRADVAAVLVEAAQAWPRAERLALTPTPFFETLYPSSPRSCFEALPRVVGEACERTGTRLIDGSLLLDRAPALLADGSDHPNARGAAQMAGRLAFAAGGEALGPDERLRRALEVVGDDEAAFPLAEMCRRGIVEVPFADDGCVLVRCEDGLQAVWGDDPGLACRVLRLLGTPTKLMVLSPGLVEAAKESLGFFEGRPCHVCAYLGQRAPRRRAQVPLEVRLLQRRWLPEVRRRYTHAEYLREGELEGLVARGLLLGGFVGEELAGFVGVHAEGSIGMLEVAEGYRRRGVGSALEAAMMGVQLARGETPWVEVWPGNDASLALQRSLGMEVRPAGDSQFMFFADEP